MPPLRSPYTRLGGGACRNMGEKLRLTTCVNFSNFVRSRDISDGRSASVVGRSPTSRRREVGFKPIYVRIVLHVYC